MKTGAKKVAPVFAFSLILIVIFFSCKNPLVSVIESEVAVAVTPPEVSSVFPEGGSANVAVSTNFISIEFTKSIAPATVSSSSIIVTDSSGVKVSGSWTVNDKTVTFTPNGLLSYSETYTITVTEALLDTDANPMAETYSWSFTTGIAPDSTKPEISAVIVNSGAPWSNSLTVTVAITATDNNAIAQMNINNTGWMAYSATSSYTLPAGEGSRTLSVRVKDGSGNESDAYDGSINIDTKAPVITNFLINNGASATNSSTVTLEVFVTDEDSSGVNQFRYRLGGGSWQSWQDLTEDAGRGSGEVSSVALGAALGEEQLIEVQASDDAGNVSLTANSSILFEQTPPSVISFNWPSDSTPFPYNGSLLRMIFDEEMSPSSFGSTDFTLYNLDTSADVPGTINFSSEGDAQNNIVELWGLELDPNTQYRVTLTNTVEDIAGNAIGGAVKTWFFSTGDAVDTEPPSGPVTLTSAGTVAILPSGSTATDSQSITLDLSQIHDDYNIPWGIKIWGDNNGGEALFEQDASWLAWPGATHGWTLSASSGTKYILYKLLDSAGNESENPHQIKVILDNSVDPVISSVSINGGEAYTNAADRKVTIDITASDEHSGVEYMMISNDSGFSGAVWEPFLPTISDWVLENSEVQQDIYIKVKDYLGEVSDGDTAYSGPGTSITLDLTEPVISWNTDLILISDDTQLGEGSAGSDYYQWTDTHGIAEFLWEKQSGTGSLYFNAADGGGSLNNGTEIEEPWALASGEGTYFVKLTLTDNAGNTANSSIPFEWDTTAPADIANLTVSTYDTTGQPTWTWDAVADADFYRTSYVPGFSPYIDVPSNSFTPNSPLTPDDDWILYAKAYDNAGNSSDPLNATVTVDTAAPTINATVAEPVIINSYTSGYEETLAFDGTDGSIINGGTNPTAIASIQWSKASGSGNLAFGSSTLNTTTISASADDTYLVRLTVTDQAGNYSYADISLLRDITIPGTPAVTGPDITPSQNPTWIWTSGGGGSGYYRYRLNGGSYEYTYFTYYTGSSLADKTFHTLEVWEQDPALNWSLAGSKTIEVDSDAQTPPILSIEDGLPALRNTNSIRWKASTGAPGSAAVDAYRWQVNSLDPGTWNVVLTSLPDEPSTANIPSAGLSGLADGSYRLYVEERKDAVWQEAKRASHTIVVDTTAPSQPILSSPGLTTGDADRTATPDLTPSWSWSSGGGGGNGKYSYQLTRTHNANGTADGTVQISWTSDTTVTGYTPTSRTNGTYKFEVKERDNAGNWSDVSYALVTVDNVYPTLSSVTIRALSNHPDDTSDVYTNDEIVDVDITGNITSELNSAYNRPVQINIYDYNVYTWDDYTSPWDENAPTAETVRVTLPSTNGDRKVYIRLRDEAGNLTTYIYDDIILDIVAPSGTYSINNGSATTPSLSNYLTLSASDNLSGAEDLEFRTYHGGWNDYQPYSTSVLSDYQFSETAGNKITYVQYRDAAGNLSGAIRDDIELEVAEPIYARKGYYSTGATRVYFEPVTEPAGTANTYYFTYYSTDAGANPNADPESVEPLGSTTSTLYDYVSGIPKGVKLYFWVQAYNADTGGFGPYSSTNVMGYSANATIIYSTDPSRAEELRELLEDDQDIAGDTRVFGTMPDWTVMKLSVDDISSTYVTDLPETNRISGFPIILTPGASYTLRTDDGKIRNLASTGRGLIAMGYYGASVIYRVDYNWTAWGLSGTRPADITGQMTLTSAMSAKTRPSSSSEDVWFTPLYYDVLYNSYRESSIAVNIFTASTGRRGVYILGGANPLGGAIYAGDVDSTAHFPVVRQGDYCVFSYYEVPNVLRTGEVFFINLVARMDDF
ncbi:MAG: Ig-like domain-containing protein [Spirochaetales bacterium]|nr:Ig-like domain-containing protein [Spirochaetales bacterium]